MCLPAEAIFTNCVEFESCSQESSNISRYLVPLLGRFSITLVKFKVISLHLSIKMLIMLMKVKQICRMLDEKYQFSNNQK